ncbi:hypothetical protein ACLOJK_040026 [Asimina triloba]
MSSYDGPGGANLCLSQYKRIRYVFHLDGDWRAVGAYAVRLVSTSEFRRQRWKMLKRHEASELRANYKIYAHDIPSMMWDWDPLSPELTRDHYCYCAPIAPIELLVDKMK